MSYAQQPEVGAWYRRADRPQPFQVLAVDAQTHSVELEYFDGTIDEWPLAHWHDLEIEACEAPVDLRGAFDTLEPDGLGGEDAPPAESQLQQCLAQADALRESCDLESLAEELRRLGRRPRR